MIGSARWSVAASVVVVIPLVAGTAPAAGAVHSTSRAPRPASSAHCSPGARTLSPPGSQVYPDTGNGGYVSRHTAVDLVYDAHSDRFLAGNHVVLTDHATQCLTAFSLDFERHSADKKAGPRLRIRSITVDGHVAHWHFVQPTYPGDPNGPNDPDKRAHEASQTDPVGGPTNNPLPPACSPEVPSVHANPEALDGTQCPANKLVITPTTPIPNGSRFTVAVAYTGRPGVHDDGDGTTDGWFRSPDGGFVVSEPLGTEDWMPLNNYPTAKPSYAFNDRVNAGKTAIANGILTSKTRHAPNAEFPHGSTTWHWRESAPVNNYLVESSVGNYRITVRTGHDGIRYYEVQDATIPANQQRHNRAVIRQQENITDFESRFNGPYPFRSDGVIVGTPRVAFEEEMETMIAFPDGRTDVDTLYHENMHQWWGDNVSEGSWSMTFFKEGLATVAEELFAARTAAQKHGGLSTTAGRHAFQAGLVATFDAIYGARGHHWIGAPSNPTPLSLFSTNATYNRPSAAYLALRQILGHARFVDALKQLQHRYGGHGITEPQLEAGFRRWLPVTATSGCKARLSQFFTQWFDTAYAPGGGAQRPDITGPGLDGPNFYGHAGCLAS
jgi:hypothetical protein